MQYSTKALVLNQIKRILTIKAIKLQKTSITTINILYNNYEI